MPTDRRRKSRRAKRRIASNVTEKYLRSLEARDFLCFRGRDPYNDALSSDEAALFEEYQKCGCNFEKWQEMKRGT